MTLPPDPPTEAHVKWPGHQTVKAGLHKQPWLQPRRDPGKPPPILHQLFIGSPSPGPTFLFLLPTTKHHAEVTQTRTGGLLSFLWEIFTVVQIRAVDGA